MANFVRFVLRIPHDLHEWLKVKATQERRSLHGQILYLLYRSKEEDR